MTNICVALHPTYLNHPYFLQLFQEVVEAGACPAIGQPAAYYHLRRFYSRYPDLPHPRHYINADLDPESITRLITQVNEWCSKQETPYTRYNPPFCPAPYGIRINEHNQILVNQYTGWSCDDCGADLIELGTISGDDGLSAEEIIDLIKNYRIGRKGKISSLRQACQSYNPYGCFYHDLRIPSHPSRKYVVTSGIPRSNDCKGNCNSCPRTSC